MSVIKRPKISPEGKRALRNPEPNESCQRRILHDKNGRKEEERGTRAIRLAGCSTDDGHEEF